MDVSGGELAAFAAAVVAVVGAAYSFVKKSVIHGLAFATAALVALAAAISNL